MRVRFIIAIIITCTLFVQSCHHIPQFGQSPNAKVVTAMTLEEKASLLVCNESNGMRSTAIPRLGIPSILFANTPDGPTLHITNEGHLSSCKTTLFPASTMLEQSWNLQLVEQVGQVIGNEVKLYGVDCLIEASPKLYTNPHSELPCSYYTQYQVVWGKNSAAMVRGVQSNGVGASISSPHSDTIEANSIDGGSHGCIATENSLKGFEIAVRESQPKTVVAKDGMWLLDSLLTKEWAFQGVVMAECGDNQDAVTLLQEGHDLLIHGNSNHVKAIMEAVGQGILDQKAIDRSVERVLNLIAQSPKLEGSELDDAPDLTAHSIISRLAAAEGMVLLKNNGVLPFSNRCRMIALYGISSYNMSVAGHGSVDCSHIVGLDKGLKAAGYKLEPSVEQAYNKSGLQQISRESFRYRADAIQADMAVITIGRGSHETSDSPSDGEYSLTQEEQELIRDVYNAFHFKNKRVVVVLNADRPFETASWQSLPDAILLAGLPGLEVGHVVADILKGRVNPSGKLTQAYSSSPFGFGLSYTTFDYSEPKATMTNGELLLSVTVTNSGKVAGKEVVQVYMDSENEKQTNKQLMAFAKTALLAPGQSEVLEFKLMEHDMAIYSSESSSWQIPAGELTVEFAASWDDVRCQLSINN